MTRFYRDRQVRDVLGDLEATSITEAFDEALDYLIDDTRPVDWYINLVATIDVWETDVIDPKRYYGGLLERLDEWTGEEYANHEGDAYDGISNTNQLIAERLERALVDFYVSTYNVWSCHLVDSLVLTPKDWAKKNNPWLYERWLDDIHD